MHCPRCGEEVQEGDRFCPACGADLRRRERAATPASLRERIARLIGRDRRTRALTAGTAVAIVVAVAAFIALDPADDETPRDAYTIAADRTCIRAKVSIAAAGRQSANARRQQEGTAQYYGDLVRIVLEWRSELRGLDAPPDRREKAAALDAALRDVSVAAAAAARASRERGGEPAQGASEVEAASVEVEEAIDELGLDQCARVLLVPAQQGGG